MALQLTLMSIKQAELQHAVSQREHQYSTNQDEADWIGSLT